MVKSAPQKSTKKSRLAARKRRRDILGVVTVLVVLFGAITAASVRDERRQSELNATGSLSTGTIVERKANGGSRVHPSRYCVRTEFEVDKTCYRPLVQLGTGAYLHTYVGEKVLVRYNRANPNHAKLASDDYNYFEWVRLVPAGILLFGFVYCASKLLHGARSKIFRAMT